VSKRFRTLDSGQQIKKKVNKLKEEMSYMDLGCGLGVKEGLDGVPQEPEPLTGIDDEHPAQCLYCQLKSLVIQVSFL
jgi:hypothetical protein